MKFIQTAIPDVLIIEPQLFKDDRGWFMESFNELQFHQGLQNLGLAIPSRFVQDNHSCSTKGVLRGLHYQLPPYTQGKLVRVIKGAVYDVAVDIRLNSATFGQSVGVELSAENKRMLWIPEGFAHGFLTLEEDTHFLYKTTNIYKKEYEASLKWNDPQLKINWPLIDVDIIVNEKDSLAKGLEYIEKLPEYNYIGRFNLNELNVIGDHRGSLVALEHGLNIPFRVQRIYYIFDTKSGVSRGFHAHKKLQQLAVCVSGKCRMVLDDGMTRHEIWLDSPNQSLHISNMVWREMHDFSEDCVLVVFASEPYDAGDYIHDYDQFRREVIN